VVDDENIIKKIFKHLGLWDSKPGSPSMQRPVAEITETLIDDVSSQLPVACPPAVCDSNINGNYKGSYSVQKAGVYGLF